MDPLQNPALHDPDLVSQKKRLPLTTFLFVWSLAMTVAASYFFFSHKTQIADFKACLATLGELTNTLQTSAATPIPSTLPAGASPTPLTIPVETFIGSLGARFTYPAEAGWIFEDKGNEVQVYKAGFETKEVVHISDLPNTYSSITELENALRSSDQECVWQGNRAGSRLTLDGPRIDVSVPGLSLYTRSTGCSQTPQESSRQEIIILNATSGKAILATHNAEASRHPAILEILKTAQFE
jgi:hypothetical protein